MELAIFARFHAQFGREDASPSGRHVERPSAAPEADRPAQEGMP